MKSKLTNNAEIAEALLDCVCPKPTGDQLERISVAAMIGLLADPDDHEDLREEFETCEEAVARLAVKQARALINELNKQ